MAFVKNNRSNSSNRVNTSTKVVQMYNLNGEDAGSLTLGFWNTYATFKINPALEPSKRVDGKVINYDVDASVVANAEVCTSLYRGIKEVVLGNEEHHSIAVRAGNFMIKVGHADEYGMQGQYYIGLFEVDQNEIQTGGAFYVFEAGSTSDSTLLIDWNEDEGSVAEEMHMESQWEMFMNFLDLATDDLVSGGSHGSLAQLRTELAKMMTTIEATKTILELSVSGKQINTASETRSSSFGGGNVERRQRNLTGGSRTQRASSNAATNSSRSVSGGRTSRNAAVQEQVATSFDDIAAELENIEVDLDDLE